MFKPVSREQTRLRLAIDGPSGSGKTYTALRFAHALAGPGGRVALIDTEHHSAAKYEGESPDGIQWKWDQCDLAHFAPGAYEDAIRTAGRNGYDVLVIDSLSHAWIGVGGALDQVDKSKSANSFAAWRDVSPQHTAMVEAILRCPCHVIVTLRSKMEYVLEPDERGKMIPRKVGMKPVQREGVEYEFDVICDMDLDHTMRVSKSRCSTVDGAIVNKPSGAWIDRVKEWLQSGAKPSVPATQEPVPAPQTAAATPATGSKKIRLAAGLPKCTTEMATQIRRLFHDVGYEKEQILTLLAKRGVKKLTELTRDDAAGLLEALGRKLLQKEGAEAF
jgi:hypothetical protein